jgi:hypothetical protein
MSAIVVLVLQPPRVVVDPAPGHAQQLDPLLVDLRLRDQLAEDGRGEVRPTQAEHVDVGRLGRDLDVAKVQAREEPLAQSGGSGGARTDDPERW